MRGLRSDYMYSVYKGDKEIAFGTIEEIAVQLKIKEDTVRFYGRPVYLRRTSENGRRLVKVE